MASSLPNCPPFEFAAKYYSGTGDSCVRQSSFFGGKAVLNQGVGYSVILGFGAFFAVFTSFLVWLEKRYVGSRHTSEWFNTAGRNVKTGLIASVIVSQWTWAATILQSSNVAWEYGVSGPFWYASGATIQVLLFGVMAIEIKRKAPYAHTVCEIVKARWGTAAHLVFLTFCFLTNIIVTAMLLLGGSAVVNALTGVNIYAASFLIPLGVIVYTLAGGLKATFLASYIHSVIVHVVLVVFVYLVYTSSSKLGSPSIVYHRLLEVASKSRVCQEPLTHNGQSCGPVSGNYKGSYLTMLSSGGLVFGIINIVGNFGTVFVDNGYWVSAIAARPSSTHKGYLLGGLVWFAVPFSLATSLGLGALALDLPITASEASHGLVPPATAIALMGKGGSILLLTMLFMAVTSAGSSELIAVSSLCTYDIYRTYINPDATGKQILRVSRGVVLGFGCFMGFLAVILNKAGVSLGWMYLAMGVLIGSAVLPIAFMLLWRKANAIGAILGTTIGCILGIITWLSVASVEYGTVNLDTTGRNAPMLAGNLVSIMTGGAIHAVCSFLWPQNYDWDTTKQITMVEKEKSELPAEEFKEEKLIRAKAWIVKWGVGFTVVIVLLWPLLSLPAGRFSEGYFTFWAIIAIAWGTIGSAVIIVLPLTESWQTIQSIILGMFTNDRLMEKVEELNLKMNTIMLAIPEAERIYLLEKGKAKKNEASEPDAHIVPA
ncbi:Urea-proton symporter DUR3 [Camellia lanceoleosa]|uniref:Urea-proton symporter DUR3 n=1 Tax=Camellia lanceoleosa TaxID=1840588 RepID=A0ACC0FHT6_9ERIC|nr:Urea-proton symporter DUR3 [Camellia lanceoleosa]